MSAIPVSLLIYTSLLLGVLSGLIIKYFYKSLDEVNKLVDRILTHVVYLLIISIGVLTGYYLKNTVPEYINMLSYITILSFLPTLLSFIVAFILFRLFRILT